MKYAIKISILKNCPVVDTFRKSTSQFFHTSRIVYNHRHTFYLINRSNEVTYLRINKYQEENLQGIVRSDRWNRRRSRYVSIDLSGLTLCCRNVVRGRSWIVLNRGRDWIVLLRSGSAIVLWCGGVVVLVRCRVVRLRASCVRLGGRWSVRSWLVGVLLPSTGHLTT